MSGSSSLLSPAEVAAACGLKTRAIYGAIERGELPAYRLCGRLRIERADFEAWKEANKVRPRPEINRLAVSVGASNGLRCLLDSTEDGG